MLIGYARVSTQDQDNTAQIEALKKAGCERIYQEQASGGKMERQELQRLLDHLRPGDMLIVWKLDRLTRSLRDLLRLLDQIHQAGAEFRSLTEAIATDTPAGSMLTSMLGAFAEFERSMIQERTKAGLVVARANGRRGGRPKSLTEAQAKEIIRLVETKQKTAAECARLFKVSKSVVSRLLANAPARQA